MLIAKDFWPILKEMPLDTKEISCKVVISLASFAYLNKLANRKHNTDE